MKRIRKYGQKTFIKFIFLIPFITCLITAIDVKSFMDKQYKVYPEISNFIAYEEIFNLVVLCLFVNCVASFVSLILYYCLENRVKHLVKEKKK